MLELLVRRNVPFTQKHGRVDRSAPAFRQEECVVRVDRAALGEVVIGLVRAPCTVEQPGRPEKATRTGSTASSHLFCTWDM